MRTTTLVWIVLIIVILGGGAWYYMSQNGMMMQTGGYFCGSLVLRRLMPRLGAFKLVPMGLSFMALGAVLMAFGLRFAEPSYLTVMVDYVRSETARRRREERSSRRTATGGYDIDREVWDLAVAQQVHDIAPHRADLGALQFQIRKVIQLIEPKRALHGKFVLAGAMEFGREGVKFVADFAHDLFEDIFDCHESGNTGVLIQYHGDVRAALLEHLQQIIDGLCFGDK